MQARIPKKTAATHASLNSLLLTCFSQAGNAQKNFIFPRLGNYVGVFFFSRSGHPSELVSAVLQDGISFYSAHLQRVKSLNYSSTNKNIGPREPIR